MNKWLYILGTILFVAAILVGFTNNKEMPSETGDNQVETEDTEAVGVSNEEEGSETDLATHLDTVLTSVNELEQVFEDTPDNITKINEKGQALEANWDVIEKQVEELDPDQYADIERSLYPLIAEAQKDNPDVDNMKTLSEEVRKKVKKFREQIADES
ncbi:hypothetical protein SAMN05421676_1064 [Salinibacillus kushneri]|uniref:Uncharacterized protein n=1 Tax=Salinibacillus kushneri TaxID=237682 RepID=A0A1I0FMB2_9BACI|nr:hypothetical protein [Salinibacillus kushneri]SET59205.1 hypothetical protein SAMN05421676_1064 [Salinibacillus kushneri]